MKERNALRFWTESYYDYQRQRIQTGNRIGNIVYRALEPDTWQEKKDKKKRSYGTQYNFTEVKRKYEKNKKKFGLEEQQEIETMFGFMEGAKKLEKTCSGYIELLIKDEPIYADFLQDVEGIGHILAGGLIAWIGDIGRFATISKLWAYSGLHCDEEGKAVVRKTGEQTNWNVKLKTHLWKIGESFVKSKGRYRGLYDKYREREDKEHPELSKLHRYNRAKRKVVKIFLSNLWVRWRELENLPVTKPYAEEYLGHKCIEP